MGKSEAHQELLLLVFDKTSKAISDPILLIDENDIKASHTNAVGILDPEQIFYLRTRGLTINQARKLICMGYLKKCDWCNWGWEITKKTLLMKSIKKLENNDD